MHLSFLVEFSSLSSFKNEVKSYFFQSAYEQARCQAFTYLTCALRPVLILLDLGFKLFKQILFSLAFLIPYPKRIFFWMLCIIDTDCL